MKFSFSIVILLVIILGITFSYGLNVKRFSSSDEDEYFQKRNALTEEERNNKEKLEKFVTLIADDESINSNEEDNIMKNRR
uniref:MbpT n=1 Tax=Strongyloides stercoralis TaxID=6248 RepID=A0A0K0EL54_STRER